MRLAALVLATAILTPQRGCGGTPPHRPFEEWLQSLVDEAQARGFRDELIGDAPVSPVLGSSNATARRPNSPSPSIATSRRASPLAS
jgi:hypothetical protein